MLRCPWQNAAALGLTPDLSPPRSVTSSVTAATFILFILMFCFCLRFSGYAARFHLLLVAIVQLVMPAGHLLPAWYRPAGEDGEHEVVPLYVP